MARLRPLAPVLALAATSLGCEASEAPRVDLPVVIDGSGLAPAVTDLGWTVEFSEARLALEGLHFTTAGEVHDERVLADRGLGAALLGLLLPTARAHPGHYQGGEIIGELPGEHLVDFIASDGEELGLATLFVGEYTAVNFGLRRAEAEADELEPNDPLIGHTAILRGTASAPGQPEQLVSFSIVIDSPVDREIVGAPFIYMVREDSEASLALRLLAVDPEEGEHLLDGVDFTALDAADGEADEIIELSEADPELDTDPALVEAYNQIRREFQTHDFFEVVAREP